MKFKSWLLIFKLDYFIAEASVYLASIICQKKQKRAKKILLLKDFNCLENENPHYFLYYLLLGDYIIHCVWAH